VALRPGGGGCMVRDVAHILRSGGHVGQDAVCETAKLVCRAL
jgi:hypothetical protein